MIAIATGDPRFYRGVVKEAKRHGLDLISLGLGEKIPEKVDIVVTTPSEEERIDFQKIVSAAKPEEALLLTLIRSVAGWEEPGSLTVAIDPGKNIGLSAAADKKIIYEEGFRNTRELLKTIDLLIRTLNPAKVLFKVGSSGGAYRDRIIRSLQEGFDHPILLVEEKHTTRPRGEARDLGIERDVLAARKILFKKGVIIKDRVRVVSKKGEIRNIQKESRAKSGDITISEDLAREVVKGVLDLEEAIRIQRMK